jgi:DNA-binding MarR family transcriptional regulator
LFSLTYRQKETVAKRLEVFVPVELSPTEALGLWHRVALRQIEDDGRDLTLRQMAILLHIYLVPPPHTVRGLASTLGVTKPVITRALDSMGAMGLVERLRDERDKRNVLIKRTVAGALYLEKLGDLIIDQGRLSKSSGN